MANPGIYSQFAQPVRSVGDYLGDMDRREGNALELAMKRLQQRTTERGMADDDTARRIFAQYGDKARNPLMEAGLAKQAFALDDRGLALRKSEADIASTGANTRKAEQEARNKQLEEAEKRISLSGSVFRGVMQNPTVDTAGRAVEFLRQNGVFPDEQAKGMLEELMQDPTPQAVAALAERAFRASISAKEQLESFVQQGQGGSAATLGIDPVTGKVRTAQSAPITPPTSVQEFLYGQQNPAFNAWDQSRKKASATNVSLSNVTKQEGEESKAVGKYFGEAYSDILKAGVGAESKVNRYNRLGQLLEGVNTGKFAQTGLEIAKAASALGVNIDPNMQNLEAAQALAGEIALELRNPSGGAGMPGAMSDADRQFLVNMVPGLATTPGGRKLMLETATKLANRDKEVAAMARKYRQKHGNIDEGFYDELARFSAEKPLFGQGGSQSGGASDPLGLRR
jgi:hypothetical protein